MLITLFILCILISDEAEQYLLRSAEVSLVSGYPSVVGVVPSICHDPGERTDSS